MATSDEEFLKRLQATFNVEADEHLQAMSSILLELEKSPASTALIEQIYRHAHSLKGAARAVEMASVESICQALEDVFARWKRQPVAPPPEAFDTLHQSVDALQAVIHPEAGSAGLQEQHRKDLIRKLGQLHLQAAPAAAAAPQAPSPLSAPMAAPSSATPPVPAGTPAIEPDKTTSADSIRISTAKLDARLLQSEEMLTVKSLTAQRAADLREATSLFDRWWKEWARIAPDLRALRTVADDSSAGAVDGLDHTAQSLAAFLDWNSDFVRSIENRLVALTARSDQDRRLVDRQVDELLADSKKLLMLPFSSLSPTLLKIVRDLCRDQRKEASLVITNGEVEIDKRILEQMKDALIHILRNCIDHGVELPADRQQQGKPSAAVLKLDVAQLPGNKVQITVSDDGAGVDLPSVKASAIRRGTLSSTDASALSDADALALIFQSEVSTSPIVTEISGRGLGMTIAQANTEKLGGTIAVESTPRAGTTFRITLPLMLATFRGILVRTGDSVCLLPTINVERVVRIPVESIQRIENRLTVAIGGRVLSLAYLHDVLELPASSSQRDDGAMRSGVILSAGGQRMVFLVDQVLHEEEVLVKPLRKPLVRVRNIAGATLLTSGKPVPILNVSDLLKSARLVGSSLADATEATAPTSSKRRVLVVEDSITSRMLLKGILESAGYHVETAVDGMAGYAALREGQFDLVVSDVEMPRLNGFGLTSRIRADQRLADLPVILVTALESREERERGIDAGASAYIVKSSFDQSNLLEIARRLT